MRVVIGVSGGSGAPIAVKLLGYLKDHETHLVISDSGKKVLLQETGLKPEDVYTSATYHYDDSDISEKISSGSFIFDVCVIVPCSMSSLAKISAGISDSLITRVAAVSLKERRKLILVPRETPLSTIALENMLHLSRNGAIIAPIMPGFYNNPKSVDDIVSFTASRIMDLMGIPNDISKRWRDA